MLPTCWLASVIWYTQRQHLLPGLGAGRALQLWLGPACQCLRAVLCLCGWGRSTCKCPVSTLHYVSVQGLFYDVQFLLKTHIGEFYQFPNLLAVSEFPWLAVFWDQTLLSRGLGSFLLWVTYRDLCPSTVPWYKGHAPCSFIPSSTPLLLGIYHL